MLVFKQNSLLTVFKYGTAWLNKWHKNEEFNIWNK